MIYKTTNTTEEQQTLGGALTEFNDWSNENGIPVYVSIPLAGFLGFCIWAMYVTEGRVLLIPLYIISEGASNAFESAYSKVSELTRNTISYFQSREEGNNTDLNSNINAQVIIELVGDQPNQSNYPIEDDTL